MVGHLRIKSPWSQLAVFIGLTALSYLVLIVVTAIVLKAYGLPIASIQKLDWNNAHAVSAMKTLQSLSSVIIFLLPAVAFALLVSDGRYGNFLGLKKADKANMYILSI